MNEVTTDQPVTEAATSRRIVVRNPSGPDPIEIVEVAPAVPGPRETEVSRSGPGSPAAGAVGACVAVLAKDLGWHVTGPARAADGEFVRGWAEERGISVDVATAPVGYRQTAQGGVRGRIVLVNEEREH